MRLPWGSDNQRRRSNYSYFGFWTTRWGVIYARRITSAFEADQAEAGRLNVDGSLAEVPICMGAERPLERQLKLQKFYRGIDFKAPN